jgi:hypothetical protein
MLTVAMVRRKLPDTVADPEPAIAATTGRLLTGRPVRTRVLRTTILWCVLTLLARPAVAQVDQQRAQEFFKEAQALCERDGGRLWGVSLCGPMVVADRRTQTFATSQAAPDGPRPAVLGLVNAPVEWGGERWAAYFWDFVIAQTPSDRKVLFIHELFHRVQPQLGLLAPGPTNDHVDAADGRYWMRLEWRALARALRASGDQRATAIRDALAFRQARRLLYAGSAESERDAEITEGLAQYTGTVIATSSPEEAIARAVDLSAVDTVESFVRSFATTSGVLYGLLLDATSPGWPRRVRGTDDLGVLLMQAVSVQPATDAAASAAQYGGAEVRASEQQREQRRQARIAELRRQFVDGPVLQIPAAGSAASDSRGAIVIPNVGTVWFGAYRASGIWGTLEADKGVLVASDGSWRRVSAPQPRDSVTFYGDGWTFKAAPGWVIREGARRGDYEVVRP